jgi:sodium transport system ATP-binding protein
MIEVSGLTKIYPGKRGQSETVAVRDVSFHCAAGQIYALLGPNGAGKTTALRMIATTVQPTSGTATVCGHDLRKEPREVRRSLGFLTGNTDLNGRLKAREVLTYFARLYGLEETAIRERIDALSDTFQMAEFLNRRCDKLSQGMKQKVSLARSVIHDPPVMIFDEPTAALDVITSRAVVQFVRECRDQGKAVLLSTHFMPEASKLADRIGILHHGQLYREGTHAELLEATGTEDLEDAFLRVVGEPAAAP